MKSKSIEEREEEYQRVRDRIFAQDVSAHMSLVSLKHTHSQIHTILMFLSSCLFSLSSHPVFLRVFTLRQGKHCLIPLIII